MSTCKTTCPHKSVSNKDIIHGKTSQFNWLQLQLYEGWFYTIIILEQNPDLGDYKSEFIFGKVQVLSLRCRKILFSNQMLDGVHVTQSNPSHFNQIKSFSPKNGMYEGNIRKRLISAQHYKNWNAAWASTSIQKSCFDIEICDYHLIPILCCRQLKTK